jgi:hypothetical protein
VRDVWTGARSGVTAGGKIFGDEAPHAARASEAGSLKNTCAGGTTVFTPFSFRTDTASQQPVLRE